MTSTDPSPVTVRPNTAPHATAAGAFEAWVRPRPDARPGLYITAVGPTPATARLAAVIRVVADRLDRFAGDELTTDAAEVEAACRVVEQLIRRSGRPAPANELYGLELWLDEQLELYTAEVAAVTVAGLRPCLEAGR